MNTVGKIFVVLIFIMSLVVMSFTTASYMTTKNWKTEAEARKTALDKEKETTAALRQELDQMLVERSEEVQLAKSLRSKLETLVKMITDKRDTLAGELQVLRTELAENVSAMEASQKTLDVMRLEVGTLRTDWQLAQTDRDDTFKEMVALTDTYHALENQFALLEERNRTLADDYDRALSVLNTFDKGPNPELYTGIAPPVEGVVLAVRPGGLLEVSIGSDDGLVKQHKLHVYRMADGQSMYLGKVEVVETAPDKVVCKILPEFRQGTIERGDSVASKLE